MPQENLSLRVLGDLGAWRDGQPVRLGGEKQRAVLGVLAVQPGVWVGSEAIADAVWAGIPPAAAPSLVQTYISRLRRLLAPARSAGTKARLLASMSGSYRLEVEDGQLDLLTFRESVAQAAAARAADDLARACGLYEQALSLAPGVPLADLHVLENYPQRRAVAEQLASVVLDYSDAATSLGRPADGLTQLRALLRREPLNEKAAVYLMQALAADAQQAAALQVYAELAARLDAELGVRPSPALMRMHLRVLRREIAVLAGRDRQAGRDEDESQDERRGSPVSAPRQLPAPARRLTGRAAQLLALGRLLDDQLAAAVTAVISGSAGIGKTALAVFWANQVASRFPDGQLYVNLRGFDPAGAPLTPQQVMRGFLDAMGVRADRMPAGLDAMTGLYRSVLAATRVLILLDNAADAQQVRPLLPGGPGCLALVTSRRQLDGLVATHGARSFQLGVLTKNESRQLLASLVGADRVAAEPTAVSDLISICAGLPLALCVAGARAERCAGFPLATLAAELRDADRTLDGFDTGDAIASLRPAFSWSYRRLDQSAAWAFRLIGLVPGHEISAAATASLTARPARRLSLALSELIRSNLLIAWPPVRCRWLTAARRPAGAAFRLAVAAVVAVAVVGLDLAPVDEDFS